MRSMGCPVSSAMMPSTVPGVAQVVFLQGDVDGAPTDTSGPWCSSIRAFCRPYRFPFAPADSRNCPALQPRPSARVVTSLGMDRMRSRRASMAGTEPPGG